MGAPTAAAHWADVAPSGFRGFAREWFLPAERRGGMDGVFLFCGAVGLMGILAGGFPAGCLNGLFERFAV
jgi:hypothetical protein